MSLNEDRKHHKKPRQRKMKPISLDPFCDPNLDNLINNSNNSISIETNKTTSSAKKSSKIQQNYQTENKSHNRIIQPKHSKLNPQDIPRQVFKEESNTSINNDESQENNFDTSNFEIESPIDKKSPFSIDNNDSSDDLMEELPTVINVKKNDNKSHTSTSNASDNNSSDDDEGESIPILGGNKSTNNHNNNDYYSDSSEDNDTENNKPISNNDYYSDKVQENDDEIDKDDEYSYSYEYEYEYEIENKDENANKKINDVVKKASKPSKRRSSNYSENKNDDKSKKNSSNYSKSQSIHKKTNKSIISDSNEYSEDEKDNEVEVSNDHHKYNKSQNSHKKVKNSFKDDAKISEKENKDLFASNEKVYNEVTSIDDDDDEIDDEISNENEIDDDNKMDSNIFIPEKYNFQSIQEISNLLNSRFYSLIKTGKKHFPATKDNKEVILRLIDQSRACHEFHFLENRCKYFEKENYELKLEKSGKPKKMSDLQQKEAKRLSKELLEAKKRIEVLSSFGNQIYQNNGNSLFDEVDNLKLEYQVSISKAKENNARIQKRVDDLQKQVDDIDKRIILMTQKKSNYSVKNIIKKEKKRQKEKNQELMNELSDFVKSASVLGDNE